MTTENQEEDKDKDMDETLSEDKNEDRPGESFQLENENGRMRSGQMEPDSWDPSKMPG